MGYDVKDLTTVRIMGVNVTGDNENDILLVMTLVNGKSDEYDKLRVYIKEEHYKNNFKMLTIADSFYTMLVKHRLKLKKKVYDRHLYKAYNTIKELERMEGVTPFVGMKQLYIKKRKHPMVVMRNPRKGYVEVVSDTLRLKLRDDIIDREKKLYEEKIKGEKER
jgi:hypothetical protein